jgi:hypothetical protein
MKKKVQDLLAFFDLKLVRASQHKTLDYTKKNISPISSAYFANIQPAMFELDCDLGRTNRWFDLSVNSFDPHYYSLKKAIDEGLLGSDFVNRVSHFLEINNSMSVAKNAAEQFGLNGLNSKIQNYPYWAELLPWHTNDIDTVTRNTPFEVKKNRSTHGLKIDSIDPDEIMRIDRQYFAYTHAKQYEKLFSSLRNKGFIHSGEYGYISAEVLVKGNEYCWKPGLNGNHRTVLLSAMNVKKIPIIIERIIRYEDVQYWPNVINGTFEILEARMVFDQIFDATPPKFYKQWIDFCTFQK